MEHINYTADKQIEHYCFSLGAVLGQGASGTVYLGRNTLTNKQVAIKVIDKNTLKNEYYYKMLTQEISIMKNLESPNIVRLLDVYQTIKNTYIVTEYCNEGDLRQQICSQKTPLSEQQSIQIIKNILQGVYALYQVNILHRDLKPANILINDGVYKITDFGFAKRVSQIENQLMNSLVGTPLYMCPQILMRQQYTSKCDVWSIGIIFYELLNGQTPWNALNVIDLLNNIIHYPSINFTCKVSDAVKQFIKRCLTIKEEDRYSIQEVFEHPLFAIQPQGGIFANQILKKRSTTINNSINSLSPSQGLPIQQYIYDDKTKKQRYSTPNKQSGNNIIINKLVNQQLQLNKQSPQNKQKLSSLQENTLNIYQNSTHSSFIQSKRASVANYQRCLSKENEDQAERVNIQQFAKILASPKGKQQIVLSGVSGASTASNISNKVVQYSNNIKNQSNSNKENTIDTIIPESTQQTQYNEDIGTDQFQIQEKINVMINFINFMKNIMQIIKNNTILFSDLSQFLLDKVYFILQKHSLIKINQLKNKLFDKEEILYINNNNSDGKQNEVFYELREKVNQQFYEILKSFQTCWIQLHEIDGFFDDCLKDTMFQQIFNSDYEEKLRFYNNSQFFVKMFIREVNHRLNQRIKGFLGKTSLTSDEGALIQSLNNMIDYYEITEINILSHQNFIKMCQNFNFNNFNQERQNATDYQFYKKIRQRIYEFNI